MNISITTYPKQHQFIESKRRYVGFIGGIGTGKTRGLCIKALLKALSCPGSQGCITSPTYGMLEETTKAMFLQICPPELIADSNQNEQKLWIRSPGGKASTILFRSTTDPDKIRGLNLTWAAMDEAAMSDKEAFLILLGRLREGESSDQQLFICTTPRGLNWVYDFFGPAQNDANYEIVHATSYDNIFLPKEYLDSLSIYQGQFYQSEVEGRFVAYEGLIYGDVFDSDKHIGDFPFNPERPVDLAWDFGYPAPEAVLAIQQDGKGNVYVIDELYHTNRLTEDMLAEARSRMWWPNVVDIVCDSAAPGSISRLQALFAPARPAKKGRIVDGINKLRSLFVVDKSTGLSALHIDRRCESLIQEIHRYRWQERADGDYRDRPIDVYNHALDAFRYWATTKYFPIPISLNKKPTKKRIMAYQL